MPSKEQMQLPEFNISNKMTYNKLDELVRSRAVGGTGNPNFNMYSVKSAVSDAIMQNMREVTAGSTLQIDEIVNSFTEGNYKGTLVVVHKIAPALARQAHTAQLNLHDPQFVIMGIDSFSGALQHQIDNSDKRVEQFRSGERQLDNKTIEQTAAAEQGIIKKYKAQQEGLKKIREEYMEYSNLK